MPSPNAEAIEAWDTILFDKFVRFRWMLTTGLRVHGDRTLERLSPNKGQRIIDLGCGFGDTTLALAGHVGPQGLAVGVDAAKRFVEDATSTAARENVPQVRFLVKDVQVDDLEGPYDGAFSRFGTMFFANPVQAFRNVAQALRPGARFHFVVWRHREANPWVYEAQKVVENLLPPKPKKAEVTCGPGPFSMANADVVSDQLHLAGFHRITFERHDAPICLGRTMDEALTMACALGPAGELLRLAGDQAEQWRPRVLEGLRNAFRAFERQDGIWGPSSAWIVGAERRGDEGPQPQ